MNRVRAGEVDALLARVLHQISEVLQQLTVDGLCRNEHEGKITGLPLDEVLRRDVVDVLLHVNLELTLGNDARGVVTGGQHAAIRLKRKL